MARVRMVSEVWTTAGEYIFRQGKEYEVVHELLAGSVVALSERGKFEAMYPAEFERVEEGN